MALDPITYFDIVINKTKGIVMYAINANDYETQNEIDIRQKKLNETIQAAIEAVNSNDKNLAIALLNEARHLCYYVGNGLRAKVPAFGYRNVSCNNEHIATLETA